MSHFRINDQITPDDARALVEPNGFVTITVEAIIDDDPNDPAWDSPEMHQMIHDVAFTFGTPNRAHVRIEAEAPGLMLIDYSTYVKTALEILEGTGELDDEREEELEDRGFLIERDDFGHMDQFEDDDEN